jgi:hypothetical protein
MANKIIMKKSSVAAKIPLATDLEVGEIAGNLEDQKLYSKKPDGTVVVMGSGLGGAGDVQGPASATNGAVALYDGTTGKLIKNGQVPGSIYTQNANNVNITGGSISGITDLAIADGGTGASTAAAARSNLGAGDVEGPASSLNNRIPLFDGSSGKIIKNSTATIDAQGRITADSLVGIGTGANKLPGGTTAERPVGALIGDIRFNEDNDSAEVFTDSKDWSGVDTLNRTGNILQIVNAEDSSSISTSSTSFIDTDLVATITPSSASNKILVLVQCSLRQITGTARGDYAQAKVFRGGVAVGQSASAGTREPTPIPNTDHAQGAGAIMLLDSPATTSPVTYRLRIKANNSAITAQINTGSPSIAETGSTITLMEVAG